MKESAIYVNDKGSGGMTVLRLAAFSWAAMVSDSLIANTRHKLCG